MAAARWSSLISQTLRKELCRPSHTWHGRHCQNDLPRVLTGLQLNRNHVRCYSGEGVEDKREGTVFRVMKRVRSFVVDQYLPLSFVSTMALGYLWPQPGLILADANFTKYCTFGVFIASGLLLERKEAAKALSAKGSLLFGLTSILLLTPLAAPLMMRLPIQPVEMTLGLAVFMLTPTTLSTGVTLIQAARANVAMALLLTLISNFVSVFTIPVTLSWLMGKISGGSVALSPLVLLKNLTISVLAPTLAAYSLKTSISGGEHWVRQRRKIVSNFGTLCLMMIPWMQVSRASSSGIAVDPTSLIVAVGAGVATHLTFFAFNHFCAKSLNLGGTGSSDEALALRRAVVLMSSQKSVTIAIAVLTQLSAYLKPEAIGIACVPCVLVHLLQTVIDSFIATGWAKTHRQS